MKHLEVQLALHFLNHGLNELLFVWSSHGLSVSVGESDRIIGDGKGHEFLWAHGRDHISEDKVMPLRRAH